MSQAATNLLNIHRAWQTWQDALNMLNFVDPQFLDYAIFHLNASERRFVALLHQARREGLRAWNEEELRPLATAGTPEAGPPAVEPEPG